jgi:hypothetical protein
MYAIRCAGMFLLAAWLMSVPALAQSSSLREKIFANPVAEFNNAVRVVAASARNYPRTRGGEIAIDWCNYNSEWGETADDAFLEHFEHIVHQRVHMSREILAAGYPGTAFAGALATVAVRYLNEIVRRRNNGLDLRDMAGIKRAILPSERALAERMNSYRQQSDPSLARAALWEQCGGDYVGFVKLKSSPDGASIRIIREFYHKLCQATGIQPFSDKCDKWSVVARSRDVPGGIYYYLVSWPNKWTHGVRSHRGATPDESDKVITIRQSGKGCAR